MQWMADISVCMNVLTAVGSCFDECFHLLYSKYTNVIMQVSCKLASLQDSCRGPFKWSVKDPVLGMTTQYVHGRARKARSARPIQLCGCYTSEG